MSRVRLSFASSLSSLMARPESTTGHLPEPDELDISNGSYEQLFTMREGGGLDLGSPKDEVATHILRFVNV